MSEAGPIRASRIARIAIPAAVLPALLLATVSGPATAAPVVAPETDGSPGIGDPYFPLYGNGGYDVTHYDIDLEIDGTTPDGTVAGTTTIQATALQNLDSFHLDFKLPATAVKVDGVAAAFENGTNRELLVEPATSIGVDAEFRVEVTYSAAPDQEEEAGFNPVYRGSGGLIIIGEPTSAPWWFPSNDHPQDKARYDFHLSVPNGVEALTIGRLIGRDDGPQRDTWNWRVSEPAAPYLTYLATGQYEVIESDIDGTPVVTAIAKDAGKPGEGAAEDFTRLEEILDFLSSQYGPYRFDAMGNVVVETSIGFALETQTRPVYTKDFWHKFYDYTNISVVVHEQAHQWWGDNVSVQKWRDIWLNEGFATWTQWRWEEEQGGHSAQRMLASEYHYWDGRPNFWKLKIGDPGPDKLLAYQVYYRGAMTVQALRNRIGNADLVTVFKKWNAKNAYENGSTKTFRRLAERVSGEDLNGFFQHWLFDKVVPEPTAENGLDDLEPITRDDLPGAAELAATIKHIAELEANTGLDGH